MKLIKLLIFAIIAVLVIGAVIVTLIYFYTDTFKPNQETFYKYISEEQVSKLIDSESIYDLTTKVLTTSNENDIKITISLKKDNKTVFNSQTLEMKGKIDYDNKLLESSIKFSNDVNDNILSLFLVRNSNTYDDEKDIYALKIEDITSEYMALENANLKNFVQSLGLNNSKTKNNFEINDYIKKNVAKEVSGKLPEVNETLRELFILLRDNTDKTNYAKLSKTKIDLNGEEVDAGGYELSLKSEQFSNILDKTENEMLTVLNNKNVSFSEKIYLKDKKLVKTEIAIDNPNGSTIVHISKDSSKLYIKYYDMDNDKDYILTLNKNGDIDSDEISYWGSLNYKSKEKNMYLDLSFSTSFKFNTDIEVEDINEDNSKLLNEYDGKEVLKIMQIILEKVRARDNFEGSICEKILNNYLEKNKALNTAIEQAYKEEVQKFNSRFTEYEGEITGVNVKSLITVIETSNSTGNRQVSLEYNDEQADGNDLMQEIDVTSTYIIVFEHDESGYISKINIVTF